MGESESESKSEILALPSSHDAANVSDGGNSGNELKTITVNGNSVQIDALGPVVVNTDGTLSRIATWHEMTSHEQQKTLRVIGKRNRSRMAELKAAAAADGSSQDD